MKLHQLEHIVRAAAAITDESPILILGSQSKLAAESGVLMAFFATEFTEWSKEFTEDWLVGMIAGAGDHSVAPRGAR